MDLQPFLDQLLDCKNSRGAIALTVEEFPSFLFKDDPRQIQICGTSGPVKPFPIDLQVEVPESPNLLEPWMTACHLNPPRERRESTEWFSDMGTTWTQPMFAMAPKHFGNKEINRIAL
jgi:hypothetical protein